MNNIVRGKWVTLKDIVYIETYYLKRIALKKFL